jgi:hypothetical protein
MVTPVKKVIQPVIPPRPVVQVLSHEEKGWFFLSGRVEKGVLTPFSRTRTKLNLVCAVVVQDSSISPEVTGDKYSPQ